MEKIMPTFECEPLVLFLKPETLDEEKDRRDTNGVGPSTTRTLEEERGNFRGGKESFNMKAIGKTYASKHILEPIEFVVHDVSFQKYAYATTKMGE
jgi:hypothetical protein